jgi:hypothetical protein
MSSRGLLFVRRAVAGAVPAFALALVCRSGTFQVLAAFAMFLAVGGVLWWLGSRWAASRRVTWLEGAVDVVVANVAITLVLAEVLLGGYAALSGSVLLVRDGIDAYRLLPHHDYGRLWTNSSGYPSREFDRQRRPGVTRIALLGDSFAVGEVRQDVNLASDIEKLRPAVEIYNFGVHAIGPAGYRVLLETEALAFKPDIVLVALFVGNDLSDTLEDSAGLTLDRFALGRFSRRTWRLLQELYRQRLASAPSPLLLPQLNTPVVPERGFTLSRERFLEVETERLGIARLSRVKDYEPAWRNALAHLRAMKDACSRRGVMLAMTIIPDEFQVNRELLEQLLAAGAIGRDDVDLAGPQRRLLDFCRAEGLSCLDLLPSFEGRQGTYLPQDTHWNEAGNLIAATAIVNWLDGLRPNVTRSSELRLVDERSPLAAR